jgi:hypothetical protein
LISDEFRILNDELGGRHGQTRIDGREKAQIFTEGNDENEDGEGRKS